MFVLWEPQVFFTQDKKAEEEAETMASCFPLRTVLFSEFILLVFLSHHLSNVSVLPAISQEKREEANLRKRKVWSHLTHSSMGLDSPAPAAASLFTTNFPALNEHCPDGPCCSAGVGRECPEAVLQPWQWPLHNWGPWGWALEQTCLSVALWTLFHVEITGGLTRGDRKPRNPSYSTLPLLFVLYLISISVTGDGVKEKDNKE